MPAVYTSTLAGRTDQALTHHIMHADIEEVLCIAVQSVHEWVGPGNAACAHRGDRELT
jgi:hypothetical protein